MNATLKNFDDNFILPIEQSATQVESIFDLEKLIPGLADPNESSYLKEAVECAEAGHKRAAIVLGWCAVIDRFKSRSSDLGLLSSMRHPLQSRIRRPASSRTGTRNSPWDRSRSSRQYLTLTSW